MGKLVNNQELKNILNDLRNHSKIIVTTNGAFDILHVGHIKSLKYAKDQGDILIVGLNSDNSIKKYKSEDRPIIPEDQRTKILESIIYVDYIIIFNEETPCNLLEIIKPDIHVKGSEYKEKIPEKEIVEKYGGKVIFINRDIEGVSTTKILNKIIGE